MGHSGSGKTSLIKVINGIIPEITNAKISREIKLNGVNLLESDITKRSETISTVFQNPKNQFYAINSLDEIAFALENRNMKNLTKVIKEMKEDGKTIIIITHDYEFIKMAQENVVKFVSG